MSVKRSKRRLTDQFLNSIEVPEGKKYVWLSDNKQPGFWARVFPSGSVTFYIIYYVHDGETHKQRREKIGKKSDRLTVAKAREIAAEKMTRVNAGGDPQTEKDRLKESPPLSQIRDEYLEDRRGEVKAHIEENRILHGKDIGKLMPLPIVSIDRMAIMAAIGKIKRRGAPVSSNRTLSTMKRLFNFAVTYGYIQDNPLLGIKRLAKEKARQRYLNEQEIRVFWDTLDKLPGVSPHTSAALRLILITAQRPGEVCSMEWDELDLDNNVWTIPASKSKNEMENRVPLPPFALEIISELAGQRRQSEQYVFPFYAGSGVNPERHLQPHSISHAIRRNRALFGLEPFTPHDLRRSAATHLERLGFGLVVERVLNHKRPGIAAVYQRYSYDKEKREALDAWATDLHRLIEGKESKVLAINQG